MIFKLQAKLKRNVFFLIVWHQQSTTMAVKSILFELILIKADFEVKTFEFKDAETND